MAVSPGNPADLNYKILLVTDSIDESKDVAYILRHEFTKYLSHCFEPEALEKIRSHKPNLVIVAFQQIETSERVIGLLRRNLSQEQLPYLLLLCTKSESPRGYELFQQDQVDYFLADRPLVDPYTLVAAVTQAYKLYARTTGLNRGLGALNHFVNEMLNSGVRNIEGARGYIQGLSDPRAEAAAELMRNQKAWLQELKAGYGERLDEIDLTPEDPQRLVVLLVDDDDFYRETLTLMLEEADLGIVALPDADSAIEYLKKETPGIILLDYEMPGKNGLELLRELKVDSRWAEIPVVMLTGHHTRDIVVDSIRAGAADFIVKPGDRELIVQKIQQLTQPRLNG